MTGSAKPSSPPERKPMTEAALPDHPWIRMRRMLKESFHRLPAPLVIILSISLVAMVLAGVAMKISAHMAGKNQFLVQRLEADPALPVLDPIRIQGVWVHTQKGGHVMTLRLEKDFFEWIVKKTQNATGRLTQEDTIRFFARGNYKIYGNTLVLSQRIDMGKPKVEGPLGVAYIPLALKNLNVRGEENGKIMAWLMPVSERRFQDADFLNLMPAQSEPMTWVKISDVSP